MSNNENSRLKVEDSLLPLDHESDHLKSSNDFSSPSTKTKKKYRQKFRMEWLKNPKYKDWLIKKSALEASCHFCHTSFNARLSDIIRHASSRKHKKNSVCPNDDNENLLQFDPEVQSLMVDFSTLSCKNIPPKHLLHSKIFSETLRNWHCVGTEITAHNLMYPVYITDNPNGSQPVSSLPGVFRYGIDKICSHLRPLIRNGLSSILLHCLPSRFLRDELGTRATSPDNPIPKAIKRIRESLPSLTIACEVCLCPFTTHGCCGILDSEGTLDIKTSLKQITEMALSYVAAGANILAPSIMIDGHIGAIKAALLKSGLSNRVAVLSYSANFHSTLCKDSRLLAQTTNEIQVFGKNDKKLYLCPPGSKGVFLKVVERDLAEGADFVLVQPALSNLDVINEIKEIHPTVPLFAYQTSGEYAMLQHGAAADSFDLQSALEEMLISMRRAGADVILTFFTPLILHCLKEA